MKKLIVRFRLSLVKYINMNETELLVDLQQTFRLIQLRARRSKQIPFYSTVTIF
jgi:hypothetical protein